MKSKKSIKFDLSSEEKKMLRQKKMKKADLIDMSAKEIELVLAFSAQRAKELDALSTFQQIPSIGIKFAEDLIFLGYYDLGSLQNKTGAALVEAYEHKKGYWIDSCVEDQFRLVVHFANHQDYSKNWWDFTAERKAYRAEKGYPNNRPKRAWHEIAEAER